jgi:hypothetical protein
MVYRRVPSALVRAGEYGKRVPFPAKSEQWYSLRLPPPTPQFSVSSLFSVMCGYHSWPESCTCTTVQVLVYFTGCKVGGLDEVPATDDARS